MVETIRQQFGLDRPLPEQYVTYLGDLAHGDFGDSILTRHSVGDDLKERFPATFELVIFAMLLAVAAGIPLGIIAAVNQNRWPDQLSRLFAISSVSIPQFWFGLILQLFLASRLDLLPLSRRLPTLAVPPDRVTGLLSVDSLLAGQFDTFWLALRHLVLPVFVLSLGSMAIITRTLRGDLLEVLNQDYIRTARAKGVFERLVISRHALRNALLPAITVIGLEFTFLIGGLVVTEQVFNLNGIGQLFVQSVSRNDFTLIQGMVMLIAAFYVFVNLVIDLLYAVFDPRIRYGS
jgi:peptide/nickel transport system permease protein